MYIDRKNTSTKGMCEVIWKSAKLLIAQMHYDEMRIYTYFSFVRVSSKTKVRGVFPDSH